MMLVEIFVAPEGCPSCGTARTIVQKVADEYPGVTVREVHIMDAADRVAAYGVFSTPFIVIDGTLEFTGIPREADLRARIASRAPS
jgi:hypothetical protein